MVLGWFPWFFMVVSRFLDQRSSVGYPCPWRDVFGSKQVSWILLLVNVPEMQKRSYRNTKMQLHKSLNSVVQPDSVQLLPLTWAFVLTVIMVFSTWTPWSLLLRLQWLLMKKKGQPWSTGGVTSWRLWWTSLWQRRHLPLPEPPTFSWAESLFLLTKCKYVKCEQSFVMSCPLLIAE